MEMTPLLDIIFLLLTFFIYSMVLTVRAQILPVALPSIAAGQTTGETAIAGITVDRAGQLYLNQEPVSAVVLEERLRQTRERPKPPAVFLALEAEGGGVDRGPIFVSLIDMLRRLGIEDFHIVGAPGGGSSAGDPGS
ncbi:MAG: biopolymer transporter ExbD [Phycisphaerae bacterium]|nr:biopolymer transporter ExbD [Phycisphaerae bacterium]